jgi:hypothetical protein
MRWDFLDIIGSRIQPRMSLVIPNLYLQVHVSIGPTPKIKVPRASAGIGTGNPKSHSFIQTQKQIPLIQVFREISRAFAVRSFGHLWPHRWKVDRFPGLCGGFHHHPLWCRCGGSGLEQVGADFWLTWIDGWGIWGNPQP